MLNLLVLRVSDVDVSRSFYEHLGLLFAKHQHGKGLPHYAAERDGFVLELYPATERYPVESSTRLGFVIPSLASLVASLEEEGVVIASAPKQTQWGLRAVIVDPDGRKVELVEAS